MHQLRKGKILSHTIAPLFICHSVCRGINAKRIVRAWVPQATGNLITFLMKLSEVHFHLFDIYVYNFRWFHDGCCECVGSTCINYGINESRCVSCPESKDEDLDELPNEDELDYGEGNGPLDGVESTNI